MKGDGGRKGETRQRKGKRRGGKETDGPTQKMSKKSVKYRDQDETIKQV